ncbi:MAG: Acriflavin resistance protein [uncultured Thiotrichaceae bacterium]|uniref:Acriflavin resistance protein n=1 Tax=uncultured Thiotrichaceae bacterium TaxID=298394 RepID=A0A6S6UA89_9GAMM|nr:MAG: Acriflavin resistance protein [uncultured Thiotrichaceae bacterium]
MFRFAIQRPIILTVAILILTLFGILAIFSVPIQMIPDLDARLIKVSTSWPGASPQDVEKEIVIEQEKYLTRIPGLERLVSTSSTGEAEIELEFPYSITIEEALLNVNNALSQASSYPENVQEPSIRAESFSSNSFMYYRLSPISGDFSEEEVIALRDWAEEYVQSTMERVPGVSSIRLVGGAERQIRIHIDPAKLAERSIRLLDVRNAIRERNRDVSGGDLDSGKRRYLLRTIGRFQTVEQLNDLVIAERDGIFVRLRDIGHATLGYAEVRNFAYGAGKPQLLLAVNRQLGTNVIEIKEDMVATVADLNKNLLQEKGLELVLNADDVVYVTDAVNVVKRNLAIGAALAILVLFLFLRSPSGTLIGAIGIPICTVAAFLGLLIAGRTINVISLAGVAFAIGMTLDNNIVVAENIYRHLGMGKKRLDAALDGVKEVWPAVLASTLTTVCVFLPVVFIKEEAGQLYSDIAIAISASILMSMLVAITLVPAASGRFLKLPPSSPNRQPLLDRLGGAVARGMLASIHWLSAGIVKPLSVIIVVLAAAGAILYYLTPKAEYLPEGEEAKVFTIMFAPPGYNIDTMRKNYFTVENQLLPSVGAEAKPLTEEADVPAMDFTVGFVNSSRAFAVRGVTEGNQTDDLLNKATELTAEIPGLRSFSSRGSIFSGNFGGTRSINVDISGPDLPTLFDAGFKVFLKSKQVFDNPRVRPTPSNLTMGQPMLEVHPDWERAAELGIDVQNLGYTIWAFSDGAYVDDFFLDDDEIKMFLYSTEGNIERPQDLESLMLYAANRGVIPLSSVARLEETVNTETIRRVDGDRTITLSIIPPQNIPLETGVQTVTEEIIQGMKASGELPPEINLEISGASDRLAATRDALLKNFLIAVIISYLLMVAVFSHWGYPLLILTSLPVGISGGIAGLYLLNLAGGNLDKIGMHPISQPFDMITMLGFLVLIGTVVNNPILIVERAASNVKKRGMEIAEAVTEAVKVRLRPIMMSTITTVAGLSPLVFNPGAGTELYRGLGAIVLFGLLFSTLVTLTFMPALLSLVFRIFVKTDKAEMKHEETK